MGGLFGSNNAFFFKQTRFADGGEFIADAINKRLIHTIKFKAVKIGGNGRFCLLAAIRGKKILCISVFSLHLLPIGAVAQ